MLDYILSKLNMLIMVTALFAIGTYFAFYLGQSLEKQQARIVLSQVTEDAFGVLNSASICHRTILTLPGFIPTLGRAENQNRLYYLFRVYQQEDVKGPGSGVNSIVFLMRTKRGNEILAAQKINTTAHVYVFDWDAASGTFGRVAADPDTGQFFAELNPQSAPVRENAVLLVKEVYRGETYLYVIPCSTDRGDYCVQNFGDPSDPSFQGASDLVVNDRQANGLGAGFNC